VEQKTDQRLGASMDGTMIYIRGEEWKELKVGCFFEVEEEPTLDVETNDWIELGHARNTSYVSHLGGPEVFGEKMWTEAKRRGWQHAIDTQVLVMPQAGFGTWWKRICSMLTKLLFGIMPPNIWGGSSAGLWRRHT
jgi:hypothetical protein